MHVVLKQSTSRHSEVLASKLNEKIEKMLDTKSVMNRNIYIFISRISVHNVFFHWNLKSWKNIISSSNLVIILIMVPKRWSDDKTEYDYLFTRADYIFQTILTKAWYTHL